jgi:hypothetical protein
MIYCYLCSEEDQGNTSHALSQGDNMENSLKDIVLQLMVIVIIVLGII